MALAGGTAFVVFVLPPSGGQSSEVNGVPRSTGKNKGQWGELRELHMCAMTQSCSLGREKLAESWLVVLIREAPLFVAHCQSFKMPSCMRASN